MDFHCGSAEVRSHRLPEIAISFEERAERADYTSRSLKRGDVTVKIQTSAKKNNYSRDL